MPPSPLLFHRIYNANLHNRLNFSKALHKRLGLQLMKDQEFADTFAGLGDAVGILARHMAGVGMGRQCVACSVNNPGGCCSREMAGETDALQMLMNVLAGVEVEMAEDPGEACCFLGDKGCIFIFKPMFCLNYNCDRIIAQVGPARSELELLAGRVLGRQYEVERLLLARIKDLPGEET